MPFPALLALLRMLVLALALPYPSDLLRCAARLVAPLAPLSPLFCPQYLVQPFLPTRLLLLILCLFYYWTYCQIPVYGFSDICKFIGYNLRQ
jgi:hypothetical protein